MDVGFLEGLVKAGSMILVSEIGDKTFFVAALLAMRHPRRWVLLGSLSALWVMTILSSLFGWAAPTLLPRAWTHVCTTLLFFLFGLRSLWDGLTMDASRASDELKEVEQQLDKATMAAATARAHPACHSTSIATRDQRVQGAGAGGAQQTRCAGGGGGGEQARQGQQTSSAPPPLPSIRTGLLPGVSRGVGR
ncbi:hypothetical protein CLOP_g21573 [Closterium sp. NIES-67]|nr:hypothetical protein CLOP_g21573 [Closterium sp. NIES-67]